MFHTFRIPEFSLLRVVASLLMVLMIGAVALIIYVQEGQKENLKALQTQADVEVQRIGNDLALFKHDDQFIRNERLQKEITDIQESYKHAVSSYEALLDLRTKTKDTSKLDVKLADSLAMLSKRNWASATAMLSSLDKDIEDMKVKLSASITIPANVSENNVAPASGFSRQAVKSDIGTFLVDIVAADMVTTRVIVDTASEATCMKDCPALSLSEYISRSGAFAGINGTYFCPADYPSCAEKKNSFDTLLMNKNKVYFNSENNVYSTVPAVIFLSGSMRFVGRSSDWGRDTSPDGVLAMQPLLLSGGNVVFGGDDDPKKGSKGNRSFVGSKGQTAFIGVVHNATVAECARVLKTLGVEHALNLDNGGSTALWSNGYKVGPGRNIPNAILFVRK